VDGVNEERMWKLFATVVGIGTAVVARRLLDRYWNKRRGRATPGNTADADTQWRDAALFAGASGLAVGLARMVSDRLAAEAWRKAKGSYPPGIKRRGEQPAAV
jgi:Protein of unknown function (DUF4235)